MRTCRSHILSSGNYTIVPNESLRDPRISLKAAGLLAYVLSHRDHWCCSVDHIAKRSELDGRTAILSAVKELKAAGYYHSRNVRGDSGRIFKEVIYCDVPMENPWPLLVDSDAKALVTPSVGNPTSVEDESPGHAECRKPDLGPSPTFGFPTSVNPTSKEDSVVTRSDRYKSVVFSSEENELAPDGARASDSDFSATTPSTQAEAKRSRAKHPDVSPEARKLAERIAERANQFSADTDAGWTVTVSDASLVAAHRLLTLGAKNDEASVGPVDFDKAMRLVDFVFDHPDPEGGRTFSWASNIRSATSLRKGYIDVRNWAISKQKALKRATQGPPWRQEPQRPRSKDVSEVLAPDRFAGTGEDLTEEERRAQVAGIAKRFRAGQLRSVS